MQSIIQSYVKCKQCKKSIHINSMYDHFQECNKQNDPNYRSEIQSELKQNRSRVQQYNIPQQQIKTPYNSSKQPVQYVESNIHPQQQDRDYNEQMNNGRRINYAQQNNYQEIQKKIQLKRNIYTEELLQRAQKKCEYCDQEYPTQMLNQHYPQCEAKRMTEQEQLLIQNQNEFNAEEVEFDSYNSRNQSNVHHPRNNQSRTNSNISYYQPQNRISNILINQQDESNSFGGITNLINNLNLVGGIPSHQRQNYQRPQQQQNSRLQPFNNLFRNYNQTSQLNNIFDQLVNGSLFGNFRGIRFFMSPLMDNSFQNNSAQGLENLAVIKYTAHEGLSSEYKQCIICVNNYEDGEELILLPCIHRFHKTCISEWFKQQSTCPICKTDVTKQEMAFEEDDQL